MTATLAVQLAAPSEFHWDWIGRNSDIVWESFGQQIDLTLRAVLIGFVLSFVIALTIRTSKPLQAVVLTIAGILYTVPGIAALILLGPYTGYISRLTVDIVLVSYTLVILIRNIITGLNEVPADVIEAARGMGLSRWQLLRSVELPLALPTIIAGLRIATVTTIGLATLASLVAQGGLGYLIIHEGFDRQILSAAIVGSGLAIGLAIVADAILVGVQRVLSPWARKAATR